MVREHTGVELCLYPVGDQSTEMRSELDEGLDKYYVLLRMLPDARQICKTQ